MAARQGLLEDLMDFGLRMPPRVGVAIAVVSWMIFYVVAVQTLPIAGSIQPVGVAEFTLQSVIHIAALFLEFAVPFCLLVGVTVTLVKRRRANKLLAEARLNPSTAIEAMGWRDFERLVGAVFKSKDFEVLELGGDGPDGGVDHILTKGGKRYFVQCKHWKTWQVGVATVRELNGVVAAQKAAGGYVVTFGKFTDDARKFAASCQIILIDGTDLRAMIESLGQRTAASIPMCPDCGSTMVEKTARKGRYQGLPFWSCSTYPKCSGKVHIEKVA